MSRRAKPVDATMSLAHFFGAEVRRRRVRRGWSQQDLADRVLHSVDLVRKVESAERFPSRRLIVSLDEVLGTNGALLRIFPVLEREHELRAARRRADRPGTGLAAMDGDAAVLEWLLEPGSHRDGSAQEWPECEDLLVLEQLRARDGRVGAGDTHPDVLDRVGVGLEDLAARAPGVAVGFLELGRLSVRVRPSAPKSL